MLTRPPRERPILPGRHTWLYSLASDDIPVRPYPKTGDFYWTSPTADGHQPSWAVMHNPTAPAYAYLWLCLTEVNCSTYGTGECGYWKITEDRPTAEAQAARHAAAHDEAALAAHLDIASRPPSTVLIPTQHQVETAVRRSQTHGPCTVAAVRDALLRMRAAEGFTQVSAFHLSTRLNQLLARGRLTVHQLREWRALSTISWPHLGDPGTVLYATRDQAHRWKSTPTLPATA
ncbi:hypothetical protein [Streptomyces sp. bgisy153]|uniref:hypothetical protein n=1 Tax=Streptomyces sp. bgisy153 TaxID=3413793 RepID=UPI003D73CE61